LTLPAAAIRERVPADQVEAMRSALAALAEIKSHDLATGTGQPRPARQLRRFSPIFPVRDADALYEEWSRPGIAGHTHPVEPTPYRLREGSHVDPDGNLIRFGSPIEG
jgi:hypothetical protein